MAGTRMLVVYGSQTRTCERIAKKMAEEFKEKIPDCSVVDVFEGNELAHELEDIGGLKSNYDVVVACTSSFGDGEPPDNYGEFLLKLMMGTENGGKPLEGMQHAVLGQGSTVYQETFQNMPRLTDRYLGECGSRRAVMDESKAAVRIA